MIDKEYTYICNDTGYIILCTIDDDNAMFEIINGDYIYMKSLSLLIYKAINDLTSKGIKYITQYVIDDEYNTILKDKTTWRIISQKDNLYKIVCKIDDYIENFMIGIGLDVY
jgi:hypothetical protein